VCVCGCGGSALSLARSLSLSHTLPLTFLVPGSNSPSKLMRVRIPPLTHTRPEHNPPPHAVCCACVRARPLQSKHTRPSHPLAAPVGIVLHAGKATKNGLKCQAREAMAALALNDPAKYVRIMRALKYDGEGELAFHGLQTAVQQARETPTREGAICMGTSVTRCTTLVPRGRQVEPAKQCHKCRGWCIDHTEQLKEQEIDAWAHELATKQQGTAPE